MFLITSLLLWFCMSHRGLVAPYEEDPLYDCGQNDYLPSNCNFQQDWRWISCQTDLLSTRFLPEVFNEKSNRCLYDIEEIHIVCTSSQPSNFSIFAPFWNFHNLEILYFSKCCLATLRNTDLAGIQLLSLVIDVDVGNNIICSELVLEEESIRSNNLKALAISGQGLKSVPHDELCGVRGHVDLSRNAITDLADIGFGNTNLSIEDNSTSAVKSVNNMMVYVIILSHNRISRLMDGSFSGVKELMTVYLDHNLVSYIQEGAFDNMSTLLYLNLNHNFISNVTGRMWKATRLLQILNLSNNSLSTLFDNCFNGLHSLKVLDLSYNDITRVDENTFNLPKLEELILKYNSIKFVTSALWLVTPSLTKLDLSFNSLTGSMNSTFIGSLVNLTHLNLNNNIFSMVDLIPSFPKLNELDLSNNNISSIVNSAFNSAPKLQVLDMTYNTLESLSNNTFSGLVSLQVLKLDNNRLNRIEFYTFRNLTMLTNLSMHHNQLRVIPQVSGLTNLRYLQVSHNAIESGWDNCCLKLEKLEHIDLDNNGLTVLPPDIFSAITNLKILRLNNNQLTDVSWEMKNLTQLHTLELQNNNITILNLRNIPKFLKCINASYNQISGIKFDTAYKVPSFNYVDLSYNRLRGIPYGFQSISELYLRYNNLSSLAMSSFISDIRDLNLIDLRDNKFLTISGADIVKPIRLKPKEFLLEGVTFKCDCRNMWLRSINSNSSSHDSPIVGKVKDLEKLWCSVPMLGSPVQEYMLVTMVPENRFLCEFKKDYYPVFAGSGFRKPNCPTKCKCYVNYNWAIVIVYCSQQNLTTVPSDMTENSVQIYLDGNRISTIEANDFARYTGVTQLYMNSSIVDTIQSGAFDKMAALEVLYLNSNQIHELNPNFFGRLHSLQQLFLHDNNLHDVSNTFDPVPPVLKMLQLHGNQLTRFPPMDFHIMTTLLITLSENLWQCQCSNNNSKYYLSLFDSLSSNLLDRDRMMCTNIHDVNLTRKSLFQFYSQSCDQPSILPIVEITASVVMLVFMATVSILIFVYRYEMQVLIYSRYEFRLFGQSEDGLSSDKMYDAFVAYSNLDEIFVAEELLPVLEGGERPFKLCVHQRDFLVGGIIMNSILEAVECSRRTIVVMSENFLSSSWCRFEFKMAHIKMMEDHHHRLIMIVLGEVPRDLDPEVKLYFKTNTYLLRSDKLFWEKLNFAMPRRGSPPTGDVMADRSTTC